jgi:hypothetical protein
MVHSPSWPSRTRTDTLIASTRGIESTSFGAELYTDTEEQLNSLNQLRDTVAGRIKHSLEVAAFGNRPVRGLGTKLAFCQGLLNAANQFASHG